MATSADVRLIKESGGLLDLTSEPISILAKYMYYETKLVLTLGLFACLAELFLESVLEKNQGSKFLLFVPVAFFAVMLLMKLLEWHFFGNNSTLRTLRIIQGFVLLGVVVISRLPAYLIPLDYLKEMEKSTSSSPTVAAVSSLFSMYLILAIAKLPGACGMVIIYRLIIELAVKAHLWEGFTFEFSHVANYFPSNYFEGGRGKAEAKKLPSKNEDEGGSPLNNAGVNDCNANYS